MIKRKEIKVIIADDHQIVIDGLKSLLVDQTHIKIIGEAKDGNAAIELLKQDKTNTIDIAVLDINMPNMDGIEATKIIKQDYPDVKILILTMYNEEEFVKNVIECGADGYILKNRGKEEFVKALNILSAGDEYLGDAVAKTLMASLKKAKNKNVKFTKREIEVLALIVEDHTSSEISVKLSIANSTVETHRRNLIEKTGVKSSIGLVKYAIDHNLYVKSQ